MSFFRRRSRSPPRRRSSIPGGGGFPPVDLGSGGIPPMSTGSSSPDTDTDDSAPGADPFASFTYDPSSQPPIAPPMPMPMPSSGPMPPTWTRRHSISPGPFDSSSAAHTGPVLSELVPPSYRRRRGSGSSFGSGEDGPILLDGSGPPSAAAAHPEVQDAVKGLAKLSRTPGTLSGSKDQVLGHLQTLVEYTDADAGSSSRWGRVPGAPPHPIFSTSDGVLAVCSCLNSATDEHVVELSVQLLRQLAVTDSNRHEITQGTGSGLATLVNVLGRHRSNLKIQEHGCGMLGRLLSNDDHRKAVTEARGFDTLIAAMATHPTEPDLQVLCCRALRGLIRRSESVPHMLVGRGESAGVPRVVAAMHAHPAAEHVQLYGATILSQLASWSSSTGVIRSAADTLCGANATAALFVALKHHPRFEDVCVEAGMALQTMYSTPRGRLQATQVPDGLTILATVLRSQSNGAVQDSVGGVFHAMAMALPHSAESRVLLAACGYSRSIIETMRASLREAEVQLWGCQVLMDLGFHGTRRAQIGRFDGLAVLVDVLREHATHEDIVERALGALWVLCFNQENKGMLTSLDGAVGLLAATQSAFSNPRILERAQALMFLLQLS